MLRFPKHEDIGLKRSPLVEVICQVRFPPILRIAKEQPVDFQERIREQFPELEIEQGVVVHFTPLGTSEPAAQSEPRVFRFKSLDGHTVVSLATNFYTLSTTAYTHWKDFVELLESVNWAAQEVYRIRNAVRIGLRYINHITFENTGTTKLSELLDIVQPELTMLLRQGPWDEPLEMINQLLLAGKEKERLTLRSGFTRDNGPVFLLDFDYYEKDKLPIDDLSDRCHYYHDIIYNAFRWCIREERLSVFKPVPIQTEA